MKPRIIILAAIALHFMSCKSLINSTAFYPDREYKRDLPAHVSELMLTTTDGIKLQSLFFRHREKRDKIVIYFHGNGGNLYHRIDEAQKIYDMGHDIIISGYRGYGKSTGEPDEEGIYTDGMCVFRYATEQLGYPREKVYIYGRSLGTVVAVYIAAEFHPGGLILVTPLASAEDLAKKMFPGCMASLVSGYFRSIDRINMTGSPLLVIHGTSDEIIPYSQGLKLFNSYSGKKEMVTIMGGRHNDLEFTDPGLYWDSVERFLSQ